VARSDPDNLFITGFMGTGKTVVGREVARRLGREFVDLDALIEQKAGKPIPAIFAEDGEPAFRALEAAVCEDLCAGRGAVIATGGGTLVNPALRTLIHRTGTVVCLRCDTDEILRRVQNDQNGPDRPLLAVPDPRAEIERLLTEREPAYASIPWQIDTTGLSPAEVAGRVFEFANVESLAVSHPGGEYPVHIGQGLLDHAGWVTRAAGAPAQSRVAVVTNTVVGPLYLDRVTAALQAAGLKPFPCEIPDGEQHKMPATVAGLWDRFLAGGLDRTGTVLSLGGGVTGDIAGFAAASFMRGVRFVQIPTTLLAMVDASVGGKTGVDLPGGKNLAGAFWQPAAVLIDPAVLQTLPPEELRAGVAETLKHGLIADPDLFDALADGPTTGTTAITPELLACALRVKIAIVEEDPFESGRRAVLNLGHTVGHALEKLSDYSLRHGEAVGIGLVAAARIAAGLGRAADLLAESIAAALAAWELPVNLPPVDPAAVWDAMTHDKKRRGRIQRWILPREIGRVEIVEDIPRRVVLAALQGMQAGPGADQSTGTDEPTGAEP